MWVQIKYCQYSFIILFTSTSCFISFVLICLRIWRHCWLIFARLSLVNASSCFNLFCIWKTERRFLYCFVMSGLHSVYITAAVRMLGIFHNLTFMKVAISCCLHCLASSSIAALCCKYLARSSSVMRDSLLPFPFFFGAIVLFQINSLANWKENILYIIDVQHIRIFDPFLIHLG